MIRKLITYTNNLFKYIKTGGVVYLTLNKVAPSRRFVGKNVLITGGSSGIGYEIAKEYLNEGATVIITGRRMEALDDAARKLHSSRLHTLVWDVNDAVLVEQKLNEVVSLVGKIDIFVNNAGIFKQTGWNVIDESMYDMVMDTNTKGLFFLCQAEGKYFVANNIAGHMMNICSIAGIKSGFDPYSISKWGAVCITKGIAKELVKYGIVVNGVAPGNVVTNIHSGVKGKNVEDNAHMPAHLTGRYTLVEEVAGMVLYLTSDLGSNIIGHVVPIDGGWTLR